MQFEKNMENILYDVLLHCKKINTFLGNRITKCLSILILTSLGVAYVTNNIFEFTYLGYYAIICILFSVILSIINVSHIYERKTSITFLTILLGLIFIVSAVINLDGNKLIIGLCFVFLVPFICRIVYDEKNYIFFFHSLSLSMEFVFVFILIASVVYAPFIDAQYSSILLNPNGFANMLIAIILGTIWHIEYKCCYMDNCRKTSNMMLYVLLSFELTFMILTRSRTGMLATFCIVILWMIYKYIVNKNLKVVFGKFIIFLMLVFLSLNFTTSVLSNLNISIIESQFKHRDSVTFFLTTDSVKTDNKLLFYYLLETGGEYSEESFLKYCENNYHNANGQNSKDAIKGSIARLEKGKEGEDISSGRFDIWRNAFKSVNVFGHSSSDMFYVPERENHTNDAHNMILNIGFQAGLLAAIVAMFILLLNILYVGRSVFRAIYSNSFSLRAFHYCVVSISFFVVAMLAGRYLVIEDLLSLSYWSVQPIILGVIINNEQYN